MLKHILSHYLPIMHTFEKDFAAEKVLAEYLDAFYQKKQYPIRRVFDYEAQMQGVDLVYEKEDTTYLIDEKAQIHYLNRDLPTFTFELSYFNKDKELKQGWLFDKSKKTDLYFLVTGIMLKHNKAKLTTPQDIDHLKLTVVDRLLLINFLGGLGLNKNVLFEMDKSLRKAKKYGKVAIDQLDPKKEGLIYFTEHLQEKPMNLQLRLSFLLSNKIAKRVV